MTPTQWPMPHWQAAESLGAILGPTIQLAPSIVATVPVVTLEGQQNALQGSKPFNI